MALEEVIRIAETPPKSPGHKAPSTAGVNTATPTSTFGEAVTPVTPPFANTDESNNYDRWPQRNVALPNAEELASVEFNVSGTFEIDPNVLNIWNLATAATSITLTFKNLASLAQQQVTSIWNGAVRVRTVQINIRWTGAGARTVSMPGVLFAGGIAPDWTATTGIDVIQVQVDSNGRKFCFPSGLDMKVAT